MSASAQCRGSEEGRKGKEGKKLTLENVAFEEDARHIGVWHEVDRPVAVDDEQGLERRQCRHETDGEQHEKRECCEVHESEQKKTDSSQCEFYFFGPKKKPPWGFEYEHAI